MKGGPMNDEDIKAKDFSCEMPRIVDMITAISESLYYASIDEGGYDYQRLMRGFSCSLEDIRDDLDVINTTLYGPKTPSEPDTEPISAEEA
jgi:hypothetical protein